MRILEASLVLALVSLASAIDPAASSSASSPGSSGTGPYVGTAKTFPLKAFSASNPKPAKRDFTKRELLQIQSSATTLVSVKEFHKRADPAAASSSSAQPGAPKSDSAGLAVDGYGHDLSYYVQIQLGSVPQNQRQAIQKTYNLLVDTGSFYTWVYGPMCTTQQCMAHNRFDPTASSTFNSGSVGSNGQQNGQKEAFAITYGSGSVKGAIVNDSLSIAGFKCPQKFGLAETVDDQFAAFAPFDGMLGLPAADKSPAQFPGVVTTLAQQGLIAQRVFGVSLGKSTDATDEGSLTIGGVDRTKYSGDVVFLPTVQGKDSTTAPGNSNRSLLWEIVVSAFYLDGFAVDFGPEKRTAIVDTGTTLLIMTPADALKFHSYIENSRTDGSNFVVPCNTSMQVELEFNGARFKIAPEDYVGVPYTGGSSGSGSDFCISNVQGIQFETNQWILGTVFLKNVYTVFDMEARQVGFATKVGGPTVETKPDSYNVYSSSSGSNSDTSISIINTLTPTTTQPTFSFNSDTPTNSNLNSAAASLSLSLSLPAAIPPQQPQQPGPSTPTSTDTLGAWSAYHLHHTHSDQLLGAAVSTSPAAAVLISNATESFYPQPQPPPVVAPTPISSGGSIGDGGISRTSSVVIKPSSALAAPALLGGDGDGGSRMFRVVSGWCWLALLFFVDL